MEATQEKKCETSTQDKKCENTQCDTKDMFCAGCNSTTKHIGNEGMWQCEKCGPVDKLAKEMADTSLTSKGSSLTDKVTQGATQIGTQIYEGGAQVGAKIYEQLPSAQQIKEGGAQVGAKIYEQLPSAQQVKEGVTQVAQTIQAGATKVYEQLPSAQQVKDSLPIGQKGEQKDQQVEDQSQPQNVVHTQTFMQKAREVVPGTKTHSLKTGLESALESGRRGSLGGSCDPEAREERGADVLPAKTDSSKMGLEADCSSKMGSTSFESGSLGGTSDPKAREESSTVV